MDRIARAKEELTSFLKQEWNPREANYFENNIVHQKLIVYSQEIFNGNNIHKSAYNQLMSTLTEEEKVARVEYMLRKLKKESLEFIVKNGNDNTVMNKFILHNAVGLNCARNGGYNTLPEFPQKSDSN